MIEEISVSPEFRKQGIAKELLTTLLSLAKEKYDVTYANGATYLGQNEMPFSWYRRIGFERVDQLFLIEGRTDKVLDCLNRTKNNDVNKSK